MAYTQICRANYPGNSNCYIAIQYQINSTNQSTKKHNVTFRMIGVSTVATSSWNADSDTKVTFTVNGSAVKSNAVAHFDYRSATTVVFGSKTIDVNSGATISVSGSHTSGVSLGSPSTSGSKTFPTISNPTPVYTYSTASGIGSSYNDTGTISYSATTPSVTNGGTAVTLKALIKDSSGTQLWNGNVSISSGKVSIPISNFASTLWSKHPNDSSVTVTVTHQNVVSGSVKKSNSLSTKITITKHSSYPAVTITASVPSGSPTYSKFGQGVVTGRSTVRCAITALSTTNLKSATVKKYVVTCGSTTKEVTGAGNVDFPNATSATVTCYAVDSRGYQTATASKSLTTQSYTPVGITAIDTERSDGGRGTTVTVMLSRVGTPTSTTYTIDGKAGSALSATQTTWTISNVDVNTPHAVVVTVADGLTTNTFETVVGPAVVPIKITDENKVVFAEESLQISDVNDDRYGILGWIASQCVVGGENLLGGQGMGNPIVPVPYSGATMSITKNVSVSEWGASDAVTVSGRSGTNATFGTIALGSAGNNTASNPRHIQVSRLGTPYVYSCWVRNNGATTIEFRANTSVITNPRYEGYTRSAYIKQGESKRINIFTIGNGASYLQFEIRTPSTNQNYNFTMWRPMIQEGSISTGYQPSILDAVYPVGSIYMSVNSTSPATLFGGTWTELQGRFLIGRNSTYTNGSTGGSATHTLTEAQAARKDFSFTSRTYSGSYDIIAAGTNTSVSRNGGSNFSDSLQNGPGATAKGDLISWSYGSGSSHNNMPPYLAVYMWKRTG